MDRNDKFQPGKGNNQPKMPKFNMNWIYILIIISLAIFLAALKLLSAILIEMSKIDNPRRASFPNTISGKSP